MLLSIAILLGLHIILSLLEKGDFDMLVMAALIVVLWTLLFWLAIVLLIIMGILLLIITFL